VAVFIRGGERDKGIIGESSYTPRSDAMFGILFYLFENFRSGIFLNKIVDWATFEMRAMNGEKRITIIADYYPCL